MLHLSARTTKSARHHSNMMAHLLTHAVLICGALFFIVPFLWMVLTSVKTLGESTQVPPKLLPASPQWSNYASALTSLPFGSLYLNTVLMTAGRTLGQLAFCSLAAYAFARIEFPGRSTLFIIMLSVLMVPAYVFLLPQYLIMKNLGWVDTVQALIVPGMFSAFGTFLLRQYFMTIPRELDEAAKLDGANHLQIYWRVIMPLAKPGLTALAIITILWSWNDLLWPLIVNVSLSTAPLSVGLSSLVGEHLTNFPVLMAGAALATWPMLVMFIIFQRQFIEGIAITGSKG